MLINNHLLIKRLIFASVNNRFGLIHLEFVDLPVPKLCGLVTSKYMANST